MRIVAVTVAWALAAAGCMQKEMTSTWYLDPDLSVLWSVLERDVRSGSDTTGDRQREEGQFSSDVRQQNHPVSRGIRQLGPSSVRVRLLRDKVPFTVLTDATFPSLKVLGERLLGRLGLPGYSSVGVTNDGYEWTLSIDPHSVVHEDSLDEDLAELFGAETIRIALGEGTFVPADGVELSADRRIAIFPITEWLENLDKNTSESPTVFTLRWTTRPTGETEAMKQ